MKTIEIQIDVKNAHQVIKKKKGSLVAFAAGFFSDANQLKNEVEKRMVAQMVKDLDLQIRKKLIEEGVEADLVVREKRNI